MRTQPPPREPRVKPLASTAPSASVVSAKEKTSILSERQAPSPEAFRTALQAMRIVVFTTRWCEQCANARAFLQAHGLRYQERDIDRDAGARAELQRRAGKVAVPTFEIDGKLLRSGFSREFLGYELARNLEKRLGVEGIEFR